MATAMATNNNSTVTTNSSTKQRPLVARHGTTYTSYSAHGNSSDLHNPVPKSSTQGFSKP